jgi:hypothetical protein
MLRIIFEIVLPLVLPTALYLGWVFLLRWAGGSDAAFGWATLPWLWLATAGVVLLAGFLLVVTVRFGTAEQGIYVPPRWTGSHIVPGHIEPGRPSATPLN